MGFVVKYPIKTIDNKEHDEFYVRIENYQLNKVQGYIGVSVAHYETAESAKLAIPDILEDEGDGSGRIPAGMIYGDVGFVVDEDGNEKYPDFQFWYTFDLFETVVVQEEVKTSDWSPKTVEYIDFDEDGNEVIKTKEEWIETVAVTTVDVEKTKKNINLINGDPYGYAYSKLKSVYAEIFGKDNIVDEI